MSKKTFKFEIPLTLENLKGEEWLPIKGYEDYYEVSNLGRVKSLYREVVCKNGVIKPIRERILRQVLCNTDYPTVKMTKDSKGKRVMIHRLVAEAFLGESDLNIVNHKDFDKTNNNVNNLEWVCRKGNQEHARKGGRLHAGTNPNKGWKINQEMAEKIREVRNTTGMSYSKLGNLFGVSGSQAHRVVTGLGGRERG